MKKQKTLIIVESPNKVNSIQRYVGDDYVVMASIGHIRDLATGSRNKTELGVDVNNNYTQTYVVDEDKMHVIKELRVAAGKSDRVLLATDPDREGEAIAWHLAEVLGLDPETIGRVEFNEITRDVVNDALKNPRTIDMKTVDSQKTRRIIDRMIGFELSDIVKRKLSADAAGRVQSAALKLIVDLEKEIEAFVPKEKWSLKIDANRDGKITEFALDKYEGKTPVLSVEADGKKIIDQLPSNLIIDNIDVKKRSAKPQLPFRTSTLQQEAFSRMRYSSKMTQALATVLYNGIELNGQSTSLITYLRTDSTRISPHFVSQATEFIEQEYGKDYLGDAANAGKNQSKKAHVQDAHEAIRPTDITMTPQKLASILGSTFEREQKLYKLIFNRTIAYLMAAKVEEVTQVTLLGNKATFKASLAKTVFDGFSKAYAPTVENEDEEEIKSNYNDLVNYNEKAEVNVEKIHHDMSYTKAPARFNEGKLIKVMEEVGIGRPSTYSQVLTRLVDHKYVATDAKKYIIPTLRGRFVCEMLTDYYPNIIEVEYTAKMENELDLIAEGKETLVNVLDGFYPEFHERVVWGKENIDSSKYLRTEKICPTCGGHLVYKRAARGSVEPYFLGCENYPTCTYTAPREKVEPELVGENCPDCGEPLVYKQSRHGRFIGCTGYAKNGCRYIRNVEAEKKKFYPRRAKK